MTATPIGAATWRDLDDAAREREYSPSSCIGGNYQPFVQAYAEKSREARAHTPGRLGLAYRAGGAQRLDLFVPRDGPGRAGLAPLLVFIHGGYWQELSKNDASFAATHCVAQGFALAALDYTLAPHASIVQMVDECRAALAWLHANAASLGIDPQRIVVAGSSAGAHLAAMAALPHPGRVPVKAAVLVSGIYELEPLVGTSINEALALTPESAREVSPALLPLQGFPPTIVCWGEVETTEFKRQSRAFAAQLERVGTRCETFEVAQRNHFDVILDLADPATRLGRSVAALLSSG
ncbi:MAG: alpha/beta hydrolase [Burkholderiaceae bacterium]